MSKDRTSKDNSPKDQLNPEELAALYEKFDDMVIASLGKQRVIDALADNHILMKMVRSKVIHARQENAKTHVIFSLIDAESKKTGFYENPDLSTSAGYITWMQGLKLKLPDGLNQADWDRAAELASASFCSKRAKLKKEAITGAFSYQWTKDGKAVQPKDLRAYLATPAGGKQVKDWLYQNMKKKDRGSRAMFEPKKPLVDFVGKQMCDYGENFPTLEKALTSLPGQKNVERLQGVENEIQASYAVATGARSNDLPNNNNNNTIFAPQTEEDVDCFDLASVTAQPETPKLPEPSDPPVTTKRTRAAAKKASPAPAAPKKSAQKRKSSETETVQASPKTSKRQKGSG